ncbi:SDR family oxidoreductase [Zobellia alginiliquefaciens]|uniref:SDR family oxidoreductase n=1 Tax=Zobellia alginiliquefaciens TaxID=3032586 RepID=UPI0023E1CCBE|nr:SDR family oxidoreductase [Zobellia alginiliquefaciens]
MKNLNDKVALVTGASRGIGAEIAIQLASAGAKVIVNYSGSKQKADDVVNQIQSSGGEAIALQADVSITEDVKALFNKSISHFGKIDVLVNNAGIMTNKLIKDTTDEDFDKQFNVNVKGTFNTMREAATSLADNGSVINVSSTTTRLMLPTYATYVGTKGAVEQMTRVFSKEIGTRGINVNAVLPGPTNTELFTEGKSDHQIEHLASMNAFNRLAEPIDIAKVICFLASDDAKWISGQTIGANGAMA